MRPGAPLWAALVLALPVVAAAQTPDLSGTWTLDVAASRITTDLLQGGGDGGPTDTLHITHAANGTVTVGNQVNGVQAWAYVPGGESAVRIGEGEHIVVTSRWEGGRLVSESLRPAKPGAPILGLKEVRGLAADGQTLSVEITVRTADGERTNALVYRRGD